MPEQQQLDDGRVWNGLAYVHDHLTPGCGCGACLEYWPKVQTWCKWQDCCHSRCRFARGEMSVREYVDDLVVGFWDTNWGRFEDEAQRRLVHDALVAESIESRRVDDQGYPAINIMGAVFAAVAPKKRG